MFTDWSSMEFLTTPEYYLGAIIMIIIAYLIGSINGGQLLSLIGSKNLGEEGSKSFGATNAGRVYGTWAFVVIFLFDMFKSLIVVLVCSGLLKESPTVFSESWLPIAVAFVVVGHCWPIYFGFKGGKGVASSLGCVIALNWMFAIIALLAFVLVWKFNGWTSNASIVGVSLGSFLSIVLQPLFVIASYNGVNLVFGWSLHWTTIVAATTVGTISVGRHWPNIKEMINGEKPWVKNRNESK